MNKQKYSNNISRKKNKRELRSKQLTTKCGMKNKRGLRTEQPTTKCSIKNRTKHAATTMPAACLHL